MDYYTQFLQIKPSTIVGAGRGLFAKRSFAPNDFIDVYFGKIVNNAEFKGSEYAYHLGKNKTLAPEPFDCWAMYANDLSIYGLPCNAEFADFNKDKELQKVNSHTQKDYINHLGEKRSSAQVCIRATCHIRKGEEIFVHYGDGYWKYDHPSFLKQVETSKHFTKDSIRRIKRNLGAEDDNNKEYTYGRSNRKNRKNQKRKRDSWIPLWPLNRGATRDKKIAYRIGKWSSETRDAMMIQEGGILAQSKKEWLIVSKQTKQLPVEETEPLWPCQPDFGIFNVST